MSRRLVMRLMMPMAVIAGACLIAAEPANADWGSHGSSGGWSHGSSGGSSGGWSSHGSWGSSGGWTSHGSHGSSGGILSRMRDRIHHRRSHRMANRWWNSSGGSSGGSYVRRSHWGSSGGSWGSSGGSSGGYSSHGSSGGSVSYSTHYRVGNTNSPSIRDMSSVDDAVLTVSLPADARVYVNDNLTSTPGDYRQYVSRNLEPGKTYTYEVRAEVERDGQIVTQSRSVNLQAGGVEAIAFDFDAAEEVVTTLKLNVPSDAKVTLGGVETTMTGDERVFTSNQLKRGESWNQYQVIVEIEREGQTLRDQQTIDLAGGESRELDFDFTSSTTYVSSK